MRNANRKVSVLLGAVAVAAVAVPVHAGQSPARSQAGDAAATASALRFEVASIKPNKSGSMMVSVHLTADGVVISGLPLHMLIREAFGVSNDRLIGEPNWVNSQRYDIDAKVDAADAPKFESLRPQQQWVLMLPLLQERFGLKFHHETKDVTVYALVVAKGGPKLKEARPGDTYPNGLKGPDGAGPTGVMRMGPGQMTDQAMPIANLVRQLSLLLGSTVIDKTNLTGKYDFTLEWSPDEEVGPMIRPPGGGPPPGGGATSSDSSGPSLFTALQEQLGLKLEARKEPVDAIVIDHIEQPSPN